MGLVVGMGGWVSRNNDQIKLEDHTMLDHIKRRLNRVVRLNQIGNGSCSGYSRLGWPKTVKLSLEDHINLDHNKRGLR